jgi:hypothetical protein
MRNFKFILFIFLLISCESVIKEKTTINPITANIKLYENLNQQSCAYHVYFKNHEYRGESYAFNLFDIQNEKVLKILPGRYDVYSYGFIDKTENTKKVYSYKIIKNFEIYSDKDINIELIELQPDFKVIVEDNTYKLVIFMKNIYDIFSISSLSVKQGSDKVRSLDFQFDKNDLIYYASIPFYQSGDWFMNISFSIKSKINEDELSKDQIKISTSNFTNVYIGSY